MLQVARLVFYPPPSPPLSLNSYTLKVSFDASSSLPPKKSPAHIASSFKVSLLFYLPSWVCKRVERTQALCSKDLCSNTNLSTCWPCEIEGFLLSFPLSHPPACCPPPPGLHGHQLRIHQPEELYTHSLSHSPHFPPRLDALNFQPRVGFCPNRIHQKF